MNKKIRRISYFIVSFLVVVALVIFASTLVYTTVYFPDSGVLPSDLLTANKNAQSNISGTTGRNASVNVAQGKTAQSLHPEFPARMIINQIGIDAAVQYVGVTAHGSLGTPNNFSDVAWYAYGPVPGDPGSAIFDGHVDNGLSLPGVFKRLSSLKVGDSIVIVTNGGGRLSYEVSGISAYDYQNVPVEAMYSQSGPSQIRLITCEGNWVSADRTYDERLIVTADLQK